MEQPTILIANPRDTERKLLCYVLEREGFSVRESRGGRDTVQTALEKRVDLILLETALWQTGDMNALATLGHHPRTNSIPVVLLGEPRHREDLVAGLKAGAKEWVLRDGFEIPQFLNKLWTLLRAEAPQPEVEEPQSETQEGDHEDRDAISSAKVAEVLRGVEHLTAHEFNIMEAITTTCSKERASGHVTEIALRDPMLMLALLGAANGKQEAEEGDGICDPQKAIELVGSKEFYVIAESVIPSSDQCDGQWHPAHFWVHSVATSRIAGLIARMLQLGVPNEAATAGLLHDIGYSVLAQHFRPVYLRLLEGAAGGRPSTAREQELIGAHHGEIARWVLKQFGVPQLIEDVVVVHHEAVATRQVLKISARIMALVVQAADQLADALFPGDAPLTPLNRLPDEFGAAMEHANTTPDDLVAEARKVMAELTTEMPHLFPGSGRCPCLYPRKPLKQIVYYAPGQQMCDAIRAFFDTRCGRVQEVRKLGDPVDGGSYPVIANLSHIDSVSRQVEALTSLMAAGLMRNRKGLVLVPGEVNPVHNNFVSEAWRIVSLPTFPVQWMSWLATPVSTGGESSKMADGADEAIAEAASA